MIFDRMGPENRALGVGVRAGKLGRGLWFGVGWLRKRIKLGILCCLTAEIWELRLTPGTGLRPTKEGFCCFSLGHPRLPIPLLARFYAKVRIPSGWDLRRGDWRTNAARCHYGLHL